MAAGTPETDDRAPRTGLVVAVGLVVLAAVAPALTGWHVHARSNESGTAPPLSALWDVKVGIGTLPAILLAILGYRGAIDLAERLPWRRLLVTSYAAGLAWLLSLAFVDGSSGISRVLGDRLEYLQTARAVTDVPALLAQYVDRIPLTAPDNWTTHVAGHPPGALLFFVLLVHLGLGGNFAAGMVVTVLGATTSVAVLVTLRRLGAESSARRAAPFLVLGPAALWTAVSADGLFAAVGAWGLAALACAATAPRRRTMVAWSVLAGLVLGWCVLMSYGLPLLGVIALAVLLAARSWWPLPIAIAAALVPVLVLAALRFRLWEAYPVLHDRYWAGIAAERPAAYWLWADLAALCLSAGPYVGAGLARTVDLLRRRAVDGLQRPVVLLSAGALVTVVLADATLMSKAEVERIWLPFVPWLLVSVALLPERWRRRGLAVHLLLALVLQHVLWTTW